MKYKNIVLKETKIFGLQRKVISYMTSASWKHVPHVSYIYEPDITEFYNEFNLLAENRSRAGHKISFNTIMLKVIAEGLLCAPSLNSYIEYDSRKVKGTVYILDEVNISVPYLLQDGRMITPAIPEVRKMSLNALADYVLNISKRIENTNIDEMLYRAAIANTVDEIKKLHLGALRRILSSKTGRNRVTGLKGKEKDRYYSIPEKEHLTEKDIMCGTITVSNIGSLYKEQRGFFGLLEIVPPQVFAVGLGSIQERPGVYIHRNKNKEIGIRNVLTMCLVFDHRAVDFNTIVPFLKRLDEIFSNPRIIHEW